MVGVLQQRRDADADLPGGGLVPGDEYAGGQLRGFAVGDLAGLDAFGQIRHQVFAWVVHLDVDEFLDVSGQRPSALGGVFCGGVAVHAPVGLLLEGVRVFVWHAQHFADHQRGNRQGEAFDEVDGLGAGQNGVDVLVGDALYRGPQRLDSFERERP